ncbi:MAG: hypothetical protein ACRDZU_05025 [Acidimicrobiales bacterium]
MPPEPAPPELARLLQFAERSREGDWSLRSALVRYAQSEPERVSRVLELVRRIEFALHPHAKLLVAEGPQLWEEVEGAGRPASEQSATVVGLLRAAAELDRLADRLVTWAVDRAGERPHGEVDAVVVDVTHRLDELGVAREERQGPPRRRG